MFAFSLLHCTAAGKLYQQLQLILQLFTKAVAENLRSEWEPQLCMCDLQLALYPEGSAKAFKLQSTLSCCPLSLVQLRSTITSLPVIPPLDATMSADLSYPIPLIHLRNLPSSFALVLPFPPPCSLPLPQNQTSDPLSNPNPKPSL